MRTHSFHPRATVAGTQTPDLEARLRGEWLVCEVKTINYSEDEALRRQMPVGLLDMNDKLPQEFFRKLDKTLALAKSQIDAHCRGQTARKIVYVIVHPDDLLNEYAERYTEQIAEHLRTRSPDGIEIVPFLYPPYYSATV